jgi:adenylate cyclase
MNRTRIATWKPLLAGDMLRAAGRAPLMPFRRPLSLSARVVRESTVHTFLRRCQLVSGVILLVYLSLHLVNHALGIWSLDLAGRGLVLALRVWRSAPGTVLLYGASLLHFSLALRTIYGRRHWKLPLTEWVRLWAGLSLPLLLIRHVVSTRLASSLYGFEPNYERIVISLITSGTQGLQLALLAPGWVHGCLGLWLRMRHREGARRAKPFLIALLVLLPTLSAVGFVRMKLAVLALRVGPLHADPKLVGHQLALDAWRHNILMLYLSLLIGAFVAGQLRNWVERRRLRKAMIDA